MMSYCLFDNQLHSVFTCEGQGSASALDNDARHAPRAPSNFLNMPHNPNTSTQPTIYTLDILCTTFVNQ